MNILSIDWDYFIKADADTRAMLFPDGHDELPKVVQDSVWEHRYATEEELTEIDVDSDSLEKVLKSIRGNLPAESMIARSHKWAYDFCKGEKDINLVNIDFHHDVYPENEELDCGNWLRLLMQERPDGQYRWLAQETSDDAEIDRVSLEEVLNTKWDKIFLCRSDSWSPPHLDKYFVKLVKLLKKAGYCKYEGGIEINRYNVDFKKGVKIQKNMYQQLMKGMNFGG